MIIYFLVSIILIYYIIKIIINFKSCYHFSTDIAAVSLANLIN